MPVDPTMGPETAGPRRVHDVMTPAPACCVPSTPLPEVAMLFSRHDCGSIPVVENRDTGRPVGIVTDRDVACRAIAAGRNPADLRALDCMTAPCITVAEDMSLEDCVALMEGNRIRRIVVVNDSGAVCGIVAQADIARRADDGRVAAVVRMISEPTLAASQIEPSVAE